VLEVTYLDFRGLLPLFDGDLEHPEGLPDNVPPNFQGVLKKAHHGFDCFVSEYKQFDCTIAKKCDRLGIAPIQDEPL
jgi:hypothetical protein